jgi:signal transduction histidine kinase
MGLIYKSLSFKGFVLFGIFHSFVALSIPKEIDSLRQITFSMDNSREKADNLFTIMRAYFRENSYESAWEYSEQVYQLATSLGYPERKADALYYQSMIRENQNEISKIPPLIRQYLQLVKPLNDSTRLAKGYVIYARALANQGHPDSAIYYLQENMKMGRSIMDTMMLLISCNTIGNIYQDISQFDSAGFYYLESARLSELSGKDNNLGNIYNNLGKTFMRLGQFDDARAYLEKSLEYHRSYQDDRQAALTLSNLGGLYLEKGDWQKALEYYDQAFSIYKTFDRELIGIADLYNNYAEIYEMQKDYRKALDYLEKAHDIYSRKEYLAGMTISLVNMGNIYTNLGEYTKAQLVLDSSLALADKTGSLINRKNILWAMSKNYFDQGNHKKAYEYYEKYFQVYKEIFETERTEKINELNVRYNNEKIQKENLALKNSNLEIQLALKKKTNQSIVVLFAAFAIMLFGIFLTLYFRQRIIISRQKIIRLEEEKKLLSAKTLVEVQEQERKRIARDLHDGLGVLLSTTKMQFSSIRDSNPENRPLIERAIGLLEQATGDVRKISHNMMPGLLTRLGLYEAVEDLFENISDMPDYLVTCQIEENLIRLPENKEIMLYRIIQEWVNNTLKHAAAKSISMNISATDEHLRIEYNDDGRGYDAAIISDPTVESLGLKSIASRVDFLNGQLTTDTGPGKGVRYVLTVPL